MQESTIHLEVECDPFKLEPEEYNEWPESEEYDAKVKEIQMSAKREVPLSTARPAKKERKAIDLDTKMKVIKLHEEGKKVNAIAREFQLSHSTVSTIIKDKGRIREAVNGSAPMRSTVITKQRTGPINEMEKLLYIWMEDQVQKRTTPLTLPVVQTKAKSILRALKERDGEECTREFVASTGWFKRFKKRFELGVVRVAEETTDEEGDRKMVESVEEAVTEEEPDKKFTMEGLLEGFSQLNKLLEHFEEMDPDIDRFARVEQIVRDAFGAYRHIYKQAKKQAMKEIPATTSAAPDNGTGDPQPSTSCR